MIDSRARITSELRERDGRNDLAGGRRMSPTTSHDFDARIQNDEHAVSIKLWQGSTRAEVVDIVGKRDPENYSDQSH